MSCRFNETFSEGDTTNWSHNLYKIKEKIVDTIPSYKVYNLKERYNEALKKKTELSMKKCYEKKLKLNPNDIVRH